MKAVVMCGGVGSRLKPVTESVPKPLVKVLNRPVLDIVLEKLISSGVNEIYLSLGYMANEIIEFCEHKNYDANIIICEEARPLGTAGGVKNCISHSDDDIIVVSGDNLFDFDIKKVSDFHFESDADVTVCAVTVEDPREYGVILKDDDGSVLSFIEKPTWELSESNLINTGIYILKGYILDMIPDGKFFDFSNDLFPELFSRELRFMCYNADGYWGDMGEFPALRCVTRDILDGKVRDFNYKGHFFNEDIVTDGGVSIIAPCLIGDKVELSSGATIGPYAVIGDNCIIEKNSIVDNTIIGNNCIIHENCDIKNAIISDNVRINDCCSIDENSVIGYGCVIGRFTRIFSESKIWPGRRIAPESVISKDMFYETPEKISFDIFGLSGKMNSGISLSDAVKLGQSFASIGSVKKIGIGCDGSIASSVYKDGVSAGIRVCGGLVYDFGEMAKVQSYFYSAYCTLDAFIYLSVNSDVISFSMYGKYGMPFTTDITRNINNNYRFSSFDFCDENDYKEIFNMSLFTTVYKSFFSKLVGEINIPFEIITETENRILKELLTDVFEKNNNKQKNSVLQILVNQNGTEIYVVENEKFYSAERILILLSEIEFASGRDILLPEDAPTIIEEKAKKYNQRVYRVFECNSSDCNISNDFILEHLWCFDPVLMCAKLISVMSSLHTSLEKLFECCEEFSVRKTILDLDAPASDIRKKIEGSGGVRNGEDAYFIFANRKGKARVRQLGNTNRIRILAESYDMETAKELSVFVAEKIKNTDIDKIL